MNSILQGKSVVKERLIAMDPVEERAVQLCDRAASRHMDSDMVEDIRSSAEHMEIYNIYPSLGTRGDL
jgi:hypothetical protein